MKKGADSTGEVMNDVGRTLTRLSSRRAGEDVLLHALCL